MNGVDKVYEYMKSHDGITSMEAIYKLEETRLSGRIFDLKKHLLAIGDKERVVDESAKLAKTVNVTCNIIQKTLKTIVSNQERQINLTASMLSRINRIEEKVK